MVSQPSPTEVGLVFESLEASSWVAQLEEVTRAASGEAVPYATGEDGARAVEVMEQIVE